MRGKVTPKIQAEELEIVDLAGNTRIRLSASDETPSIDLLTAGGSSSASLRLNGDGRPSLLFNNLTPDGPTAILEIDDKGAHIKFNRETGASTYLFLNNAGGSGVVIYDAEGQRRLSIVVAPDGKISISPFPFGGD